MILPNHSRLGIRILWSALLFLVAPGCSPDREGERIGNRPPQVRISGGPREGGSTNYRARVFWTGWDHDGVIDHYEYAIDPPSVFTQNEIAYPEEAEGISRTVFSGPGSKADTIRIQKTVGDKLYEFDYVQTVFTDRTFSLETPQTDTVVVNSKIQPGLTASGVHTVHVRAMDNDGAYSNSDHLGFTAWTYTPSAAISFPDIRDRNFLSMGSQVIISWGGYDPDSFSPPVGYLYKLVDLKALDPPLSVLFYDIIDPASVVFEKAVDVPWTYMSAETTGITMFVPTPGEYLFAVRAVDVSGGTEPFVEWSRTVGNAGNAFMILAQEKSGHPTVTISERTLGTFSFRGNTVRPVELETPVGTPLRFEWTATAERYGGQIEGYSWGLNIADLDATGPTSGWSPWGQSLTRTPDITINNPGVHVLYVRVRDTHGFTTTGAILMEFFDLPFDREVLYVDDYLDRLRPLDREHDEFWKDLFWNSGRFEARTLQSNYWYESGGDGDRTFVKPTAPRLSFLGHYKLLVWNTHGAGFCGRTGFFTAAVLTNHLRSYLQAGGKLWLSGKMSLAPTIEGKLCPDPDSPFGGNEPSFPAGQTEYPHSYAPGDFAWDFFKLYTLRAENDKGFNWFSGLERVEAWDRTNPIFPDLEVDPEKVGLGIWNDRGLTHVDAVFDPIFTGSNPDFAGKLDSLYSYIAVGQVRKPGDSRVHSTYHKRLCATRWHDPDPDRSHGRVMWFGFPLYYIRDAVAQETFNRAIDWFNQEERPITP